MDTIAWKLNDYIILTFMTIPKWDTQKYKSIFIHNVDVVEPWQWTKSKYIITSFSISLHVWCCSINIIYSKSRNNLLLCHMIIVSLFLTLLVFASVYCCSLWYNVFSQYASAWLTNGWKTGKGSVLVKNMKQYINSH